MKIKRVETVAQYKAEQAKHIETWIAERFNTGCITWELKDAFTVTLKDKSGATLDIALSDIP